MHPRLLSTLVLCEPVILDESPSGPNPAMMSTLRRDRWPTRAKAEDYFRKGFASWDSRALQKYLRHGLRDLPTALYNPSNQEDLSPESVILTTSKHQEAWAYLQANLEPEAAGLDRILLPDWEETQWSLLATRPECFWAMQNLPYVRPSVYYIFGDTSYLSPPHVQQRKVEKTGTGTGGNGGSTKGKVGKMSIKNRGHLVIFEKPGEVADGAGEWVKKWFDGWQAEEQFWQHHESKSSEDGMLRMSKAWIEATKLPAETPRPKTKL